jgi:hypothetical protein
MCLPSADHATLLTSAECPSIVCTHVVASPDTSAPSPSCPSCRSRCACRPPTTIAGLLLLIDALVVCWVSYSRTVLKSSYSCLEPTVCRAGPPHAGLLRCPTQPAGADRAPNGWPLCCWMASVLLWMGPCVLAVTAMLRSRPPTLPRVPLPCRALTAICI